MNFLKNLVLRKGLTGSSRFFTTLTIIGFVFKGVRKLSGNEPKTLYTYELKPGESLVVADTTSSKKSKKK